MAVLRLPGETVSVLSGQLSQTSLSRVEIRQLNAILGTKDGEPLGRRIVAKLNSVRCMGGPKGSICGTGLLGADTPHRHLPGPDEGSGGDPNAGARRLGSGGTER